MYHRTYLSMQLLLRVCRWVCFIALARLTAPLLTRPFFPLPLTTHEGKNRKKRNPTSISHARRAGSRRGRRQGRRWRPCYPQTVRTYEGKEEERGI